MNENYNLNNKNNLELVELLVAKRQFRHFLKNGYYIIIIFLILFCFIAILRYKNNIKFYYHKLTNVIEIVDNTIVNYIFVKKINNVSIRNIATINGTNILNKNDIFNIINELNIKEIDKNRMIQIRNKILDNPIIENVTVLRSITSNKIIINITEKNIVAILHNYSNNEHNNSIEESVESNIIEKNNDIDVSENIKFDKINNEYINNIITTENGKNGNEILTAISNGIIYNQNNENILNDNTIILLDKNGRIIKYSIDKNNKNYVAIALNNIINIYDMNEMNNFTEFYQYLSSKKEIINHVKYLKFFPSIRWNIVLKNGLIIKLPRNNWKQTIDYLLKMNEKFDLITQQNSDIKHIDMRIADKIFIAK